MPHGTKIPQIDPKDKVLQRLAQSVREEVQRRYGADLTFEQRRDAAMSVVTEVLWLDEEQDLRALVTRDEEVEVEGRRYRRLEQRSSGVYYGRWGGHLVEEPLYREVGVHNGPTIKPVELLVGMIARHMTPDLARIVGELSAHGSSREVETMMSTVGLVPPSRAFLEKRTKQMAGELAAEAASWEEAARTATTLPAEVGSISCGMDRMAVRMAEPQDPETAEPPSRTEPYQRKPPPPKEHNWRMAWAGTTTIYDVHGDALHTWRYAAEADADVDEIAERVTADVSWVLGHHPDVPVQCIQDAAPELRALPEALANAIPANTNVQELVDFEHLMGYLEDVVDACEEPGDPHNWKRWYRMELLGDDSAIDRIWRKLRRLAKELPRNAAKKRKAVAAAISYIRNRKHKMRYASSYAAGLAIGSGATEGTCGLMQARVKRRGQSWEPPGLRGILTIRGLVLSERWHAAWQLYAATHRKQVRRAA
jgi:hypothetical protein